MTELSLEILIFLMAERMGFEPMIEFPLYTLSKRAPSTTRPPLLDITLIIYIKKLNQMVEIFYQHYLKFYYQHYVQ